MELVIYLFIRYAPIVYVIWFFIRIYQLRKKNRAVPDAMVKVNLVIIAVFFLFYYYLIPVQGFLLWGTVTQAEDYGTATANAVIMMTNYGFVLLVFCLLQAVFFLILRPRKSK